MTTLPRKTYLPLLTLLSLLPATEWTVSVHLHWHAWVTYPAFQLLIILIPASIFWYSGLSLKDVGSVIGWKRTNTLAGWVVGIIMVAIMLIAYYGYMRPRIDPSKVLDRLGTFNFRDHYWILVVYLSFFNSFVEEYYWRGFILAELRSRIPGMLPLCIISGVLFGLHHLVATLAMFPWPVVIVATGGSAIAGGVWAWMRLRGDSIFDCYISHIVADFGVMWIGYDLMKLAESSS